MIGTELTLTCRNDLRDVLSCSGRIAQLLSSEPWALAAQWLLEVGSRHRREICLDYSVGGTFGADHSAITFASLIEPPNAARGPLSLASNFPITYR
jgi:hypothetical protein